MFDEDDMLLGADQGDDDVFRSGGLTKHLFATSPIQLLTDGAFRLARYIHFIRAPFSSLPYLLNELPFTKTLTAEVRTSAGTSRMTAETLYKELTRSIPEFIKTGTRTEYLVDATEHYGQRFKIVLMRATKRHNSKSSAVWRTIRRKETETTKDILLIVHSRDVFVMYPSIVGGKIYVRPPGHDSNTLRTEIQDLNTAIEQIRRSDVPLLPPYSIPGELLQEDEVTKDGTTTYRAGEMTGGGVGLCILGYCGSLCWENAGSGRCCDKE